MMYFNVIGHCVQSRHICGRQMLDMLSASALVQIGLFWWNNLSQSDVEGTKHIFNVWGYGWGKVLARHCSSIAKWTACFRIYIPVFDINSEVWIWMSHLLFWGLRTVSHTYSWLKNFQQFDGYIKNVCHPDSNLNANLNPLSSLSPDSCSD